MARCVVLADVRSNHYKASLFRELHRLVDGLVVLYAAENERRREWIADPEALAFPHERFSDGLRDDVGAAALAAWTWRRLSALDPETVVVDGYVDSSGWAALAWARLRRRRLVLWSSSNEDDRPRCRHKEAVKRLFVRRFDAYHAYSERSKRYLVRLGARAEHVGVIGNATDSERLRRETERWRGRKAELREPHVRERNFLFVGRLHPEKNVFLLLDAYRRLDERARARWGLILVGDGPDRPAVEAYLGRHRLHGAWLAGPQRPADLPRLMALGTVLVLPSVCDPWGLVVNEAMAVGLPVFVSRRCGCYPDLVREGENGFSFDPKDRDELFRLLQSATAGSLDLPAMGRVSEELIRRFTPRAMAERIAPALQK